MQCDIQKASLWKRFAAALLDLILVVIIVTGMFAILSGWFGVDRYVAEIGQIYDRYEEKYDLNYDMTAEEFAALPEAEQTAYNERVLAADRELRSNPEEINLYIKTMLVILAVITIGILVAMLILEFGVPLLFGNGQTVGKKVFSLAVIRQDSVAITPLQLFVRTILGKFAVETMIPVCIAIMYTMGLMNLFLLLLIAALAIGEIAILIVTRNNCLLHDLIAGTVVVDYSSQRIFLSMEDKQTYEARLEAERENRQLY